MQSSHTLASSGTCTHTDTHGQLKREHKNTFKIKNKVKSDRSRPDLNFALHGIGHMLVNTVPDNTQRMKDLKSSSKLVQNF